jgi:hypothetical protein
MVSPFLLSELSAGLRDLAIARNSHDVHTGGVQTRQVNYVSALKPKPATKKAK